MVDWLGFDGLPPPLWTPSPSILEWWSKVAEMRGSPEKATATTLILITREIWNERNVRIFHNKATASLDLLTKIKEKDQGACWTSWQG